MKKFSLPLFGLLAVIVSFSACKKDEQAAPQPNEDPHGLHNARWEWVFTKDSLGNLNASPQSTGITQTDSFASGGRGFRFQGGALIDTFKYRPDPAQAAGSPNYIIDLTEDISFTFRVKGDTVIYNYRRIMIGDQFMVRKR
jgi:hypothetical protein